MKLSVGTKFRAGDVKTALALLIKDRGLPNAIRCDNGSEFIERDLVAGIAPGSSWQKRLL